MYRQAQGQQHRNRGHRHGGNAKSQHRGYGFVKYRKLEITQYVLSESGNFKLDNSKIFFNLSKLGLGLKRGEIRDRISCWFCLENPDADRSLVAHEGKDFYIALDKGPIEPFHMLLIPQIHVGSTIDLKNNP